VVVVANSRSFVKGEQLPGASQQSCGRKPFVGVGTLQYSIASSKPCCYTTLPHKTTHTNSPGHARTRWLRSLLQAPLPSHCSSCHVSHENARSLQRSDRHHRRPGRRSLRPLHAQRLRQIALSRPLSTHILLFSILSTALHIPPGRRRLSETLPTPCRQSRPRLLALQLHAEQRLTTLHSIHEAGRGRRCLLHGHYRRQRAPCCFRSRRWCRRLAELRR